MAQISLINIPVGVCQAWNTDLHFIAEVMILLALTLNTSLSYLTHILGTIYFCPTKEMRIKKNYLNINEMFLSSCIWKHNLIKPNPTPYHIQGHT
jgi:hypothetical protein